MKTIVIESASPLSWYFIADSALVNSGKPFFIPEFADEFEAFLALVIRLNRLGKSIGARFAHRYYAEAAPGVHFRASALRRKLLAAGLSPDRAHSFDRSFTIGNFLPVERLIDGQPLKMTRSTLAHGYGQAHKNPAAIGSYEITEELESVDITYDPEKLKESIGRMLEAVSATNTVKMGDCLVPILSSPLKIAIGDLLTVTHGSEKLLSIHIK